MKIYKEKAGVISDTAVWICFHDCYMYSGDTFWQLLKDMCQWWNHDCRLIG